MYLSDVDLREAIDSGKLVFEPSPEGIDATSIDLHLDRIEEAKIWNIAKYSEDEQSAGRQRPELRIGQYNLANSRLAISPRHRSTMSTLLSLCSGE